MVRIVLFENEALPLVLEKIIISISIITQTPVTALESLLCLQPISCQCISWSRAEKVPIQSLEYECKSVGFTDQFLVV